MNNVLSIASHTRDRPRHPALYLLLFVQWEFTCTRECEQKKIETGKRIVILVVFDLELIFEKGVMVKE